MSSLVRTTAGHLQGAPIRSLLLTITDLESRVSIGAERAGNSQLDLLFLSQAVTVEIYHASVVYEYIVAGAQLLDFARGAFPTNSSSN